MSGDPFSEVRAEVEASLESAASQLRIIRSAQASVDDREWSIQELKATLSALDSDVRELLDSVDAVHQDPGRFRLTSSEIQSRRQFIDRVNGTWSLSDVASLCVLD